MRAAARAGGLQRLVWSLTPPILRPAVRRLRRALARLSPRLREWEHVQEGWARQHTDPRIGGWDSETVREAYGRKLPALRRALEGAAPLAFPTSPALPVTIQNVRYQNAILAYAYALTLASRNSDGVSILDWGGGLGFFYLLGRALLPPAVEIDYHCKEVPAVCAKGREAMPDVLFHEDEACLDRRYDLVLASSSLQYSEEWSDVLERLAAATARYLYVTRVPVVFSSGPFVVRQRAYRYGYEHEYLSWVLNRDQLVDAAERSGMELVREFLLGDKPVVHGAPDQDETRGFLFRPADARPRKAGRRM